MTNRLRVQVVAVCVVAVFAIGLWVDDADPQPAWLRWFSVAVLTATVALTAWDRWLWRSSMAQRSSRVAVDLRGTWKGTLTSFWTDPATGKPPPPKPAFLIVRQSSDDVSVTLVTAESRSRSTLGKVTRSVDGAELAYLYLNRPDLSVRERSRMHHGSTVLDVTGAPVTRLRGRYWTDRDSSGELDFTEHRRGFADDYDQAVAFFESVAS